MKKTIKIIIIYTLIFSMFIICPCIAYAEANEEIKITMTDYYIPFDVWQGDGSASATIKYHRPDDSIDQKLQFENFNRFSFLNNEPVDANCYTVENSNGWVKITLNEEYLHTLNDGKYYYKADYKGIEIELILFVITKKETVSNIVFESELWNGTDWANFNLTDITYPLSNVLLENISLNGEELNKDFYNISFMGNNGIVAISPDYLKTLPAGTHFFDMEFMSVSGIQLKLEIPDIFCTGDADGNGVVNAADARLTLRVSAKLESLSDNAKNAADVDNDSRITAADARKILRVVAELEDF